MAHVDSLLGLASKQVSPSGKVHEGLVLKCGLRETIVSSDPRPDSEQVLSQASPPLHRPPSWSFVKTWSAQRVSLLPHTSCHPHLKLSDPQRAQMVAGAGCPVTTAVLGSLWSSLNANNNKLIPVVATQRPEENGGCGLGMGCRDRACLCK